MDVICYVQNKNGISKPFVEPIGMGNYLLIRVEIDVSKDSWFDECLRKPEGWGRLPRVAAQEEAERRFQCVRRYHRAICLAEISLRNLARAVKEIPEPDSTFYMAYEKKLSFLAKRERTHYAPPMMILWQEYMPFPEFNGYKKSQWLHPVIPDKVESNILVLGTADAIYQILEKSSRQIKELKWILFREECDERFLHFVDMCYREYGLVVRYQILEELGQLTERGIICDAPTTIFDFWDLMHVPLQHVVVGCTWIDVMSVPEKQRQLEKSVNYISLHKIWSEKQKEYNRPYFLDRVGEKGYNAIVPAGVRGYKSIEQR